jgi:hypothetical protein
MKSKPSECKDRVYPDFNRRSKAGREANLYKASFIKRRLFFSFVQSPNALCPDIGLHLCYKGMQ